MSTTNTTGGPAARQLHLVPVGGGADAPGQHAPEASHSLLVRIERERRRSGLTMTELARAAGLPVSTVRTALAPGGNPQLETLERLARGLDLRLSLTL